MDYKEKAAEMMEILPQLKGPAAHIELPKFTKGEFMMLVTLHRNNNCMKASELAKKCGVSTARTTVAIDSMEKKGYVQREKMEGDRRMVNIILTEKGQKSAEGIYQNGLNHMAAYLEFLGEEDAQKLYEILLKSKDFLKTQQAGCHGTLC